MKNGKGKRIEMTLAVLKPDALKRGIAGIILDRFKESGLTILEAKVVQPTRDHLDCFFTKDTERLKGLGEKCIAGCKKDGLNPFRELGSEDPLVIGKMIDDWNIKFYLSGQVIPALLAGKGAIQKVRDLIGHTDPTKASLGTIRRDFSLGHSITYYNVQKMACRNLIHASGNAKEAEQEIKAWFSGREIMIAKIKQYFV